MPIDIPSISPLDTPSASATTSATRGGKTRFGKNMDKGRPAGAAFSGNDPTAPPERQSLFVDAEKPTKLMAPTKPPTKRERGGSGAGPAAAGEPHTVIAGRVRPESGADEAESADPVVGWLAVVDGPGKGASICLGNGQNSIGRGEGSRVRLDFGDRQISRNGHAVLTYDPKGNCFFIQPGHGVNLVYLDEKLVLSPTPLPHGSRITLGETTLRFVALCDDKFTWQGGA